MNGLADIIKNAAFDTALATAALTAAGWFATWTYGLIRQRLEAKEKKRIAIVRFYADVRLRAEGLAGLFDPATLAHLKSQIEKHDREGRPFRMYGTQVSDNRSQERINIYLHTFLSQEAYLIRKFILSDRLLVLAYDKLQSDAFEALSADRKIAALYGCAEAARDLKSVAEDVQAMIEGWPTFDGASGTRP